MVIGGGLFGEQEAHRLFGGCYDYYYEGYHLLCDGVGVVAVKNHNENVMRMVVCCVVVVVVSFYFKYYHVGLVLSS